MPNVRIVTDSASDLPADLARQHGISVVPLTVRFGDEELADGVDLTPSDFWARCRRSPTLPETSAPSPGQFEEVFRAAEREGYDGALCITLSSQLSATFQAAQVAAQAVGDAFPVRVVDSRSVSMAEGLICLGAAQTAESGKDVDELVAEVDRLAARTRLVAALDTLENLRKGGRVGGAAALVGSVLSIKPVIEVRDGRVEPESKQRTRARALRHLADKVRDQPVERMAVVHGNAPDLDAFIDMLGPSHSRDRIIVADIGAVIGTHAGPGAIGVAFQVPPP